jgi:hypothetical protein
MMTLLWIRLAIPRDKGHHQGRGEGQCGTKAHLNYLVRLNGSPSHVSAGWAVAQRPQRGI